MIGRVVAFTCARLVLVDEVRGEGDSPAPPGCVGVGVESICQVRVGEEVTWEVISLIPRLSGVRGRQDDRTNHKPRNGKNK